MVRSYSGNGDVKMLGKIEAEHTFALWMVPHIQCDNQNKVLILRVHSKKPSVLCPRTFEPKSLVWLTSVSGQYCAQAQYTSLALRRGVTQYSCSHKHKNADITWLWHIIDAIDLSTIVVLLNRYIRNVRLQYLNKTSPNKQKSLYSCTIFSQPLLVLLHDSHSTSLSTPLFRFW